MVEFDELGGVLAFIDVVCKKFWERHGSAGSFVIVGWDDV